MNPHFEQREVVIGGRPMVYRRSIVACEAEVAWRPRVVLVHGLGLSGRCMLPVAACLAEAYRVFLPDLPGFGDSSHPHEVLDVGGLADALAAWLDAMDLPRVALLGNSFGCQIIVDLAARHLDRLERAILQGPTAPPQERTWLRQAIRWQQNQRLNPASLGPVTWSDYRQAASSEPCGRSAPRCAIRSRRSCPRSPARRSWCAAPRTRSAARTGPSSSTDGCRSDLSR